MSQYRPILLAIALHCHAWRLANKETSALSPGRYLRDGTATWKPHDFSVGADSLGLSGGVLDSCDAAYLIHAVGMGVIALLQLL